MFEGQGRKIKRAPSVCVRAPVHRKTLSCFLPSLPESHCDVMCIYVCQLPSSLSDISSGVSLEVIATRNQRKQDSNLKRIKEVFEFGH